MVNVKEFFDTLNEEGVRNFSGVPDSLLKSVCAYISDNTEKSKHLITANEGSAIALAVGQYISSGKPSLVYLQNSGMGNAINPLLSLADPEVYGIPMVILIGWRGEPGVKDEPQHTKQGAVTKELLEVCSLPTEIIDSQTENIKEILKDLIKKSIKRSQPVVLLAKKGTFEDYTLRNTNRDIANISREKIIESIVDSSDANDVFVSTTGMASRELFEIREQKRQSHDRDFLTVGSMGHACMIALGIAQNTSKQVVCIDGDGSSIMHLGNLTSIGQSNQKNLIHIVINNAAHDSVGGQPTIADEINLPNIARSCGYNLIYSINKIEDLKEVISLMKSRPGPHFFEIKACKGSRKDLGRPTSTPLENKVSIMQSLKS